ncbi:hypothetical protein FQN54_000250 [Arachnomyces sp. PD_36]|nr:hypothetical protein FQN54_000250 [Arachnomyces sp. PD_36]
MSTWLSFFLQSLRESQYTHSVDQDFLTSSTFNYINPKHHHVASTDTLSQTLPPSSISGRSDEEILASFTKGFFGGPVFAFESFLLRYGGWRLIPAGFTGFQDDPSATTIWSLSDVPSTHLLPIGSTLFGSFKVLDKSTLTTTEPPQSTTASKSHVDYAYGSDTFTFAGCHRFVVIRDQPPYPTTTTTSTTDAAADEEKEPPDANTSHPQVITIQLQGFRCNPLQNKPSVLNFIETFHYIYAKALFANGMQAVLAGSSSSKEGE